MAPQAAVLHVDRFRKVGGDGEEAVAGDVIHPLDDFGNRAARSGDLAGLAEERDVDLLLRAGYRIAHRDLLRLDRAASRRAGGRRGTDRSWREMRSFISSLTVSPIATRRSASQSPRPFRSSSDITTSIFVLNWISRSRVIAHRALADALELHSVMLLERLGQSDEIIRVHLHRVRMARVAHQLIAEAGDLAVDGCRPIALGRLADGDHRTAVVRVPIVHRLQRRDYLGIVIAVRQREDVPAIRCPLVDQIVAVELRGESRRPAGYRRCPHCYRRAARAGACPPAAPTPAF